MLPLRHSALTPPYARGLSSAVFAQTASSLSVVLVGALAVQMLPTLGLTLGTLGLAVSIYYFTAAAGSVAAGRLAEWLGGARAIRLTAASAAVILVGLGEVVRSVVGLFVLLGLAGAVSALMNPATNLFLLRRIPKTRQGLAFGTKQAAVPFAALLAGLAVPSVALTVGWRWAFVVAAGVAGVAAILAPRSRTSLATRRRQRAGHAPRVSLLPLLALAVSLGLGVFASAGLTTFLVASAVSDGLGKGAAGLVAALAAATAVVVRVFTGLEADRSRRGHLILVSAMVISGAGGYALLAIATMYRAAWIVVLGAVVAYGAGWGWNGLFNFAIARSHSDAPALATGVTQTGGRLAGAFGPLIFGVLVVHGSFAFGWMVCSVAAIGSGIMVLYGRHLLLAESVRAGPSTSRDQMV